MDLIIPFTDRSPSFTYGVEFGRLLQKMQEQKDHITNDGFPVRTENKKVIMAAANKYGYIPVFGEEQYDGWVEFMGIKKVSLNN